MYIEYTNSFSKAVVQCSECNWIQIPRNEGPAAFLPQSSLGKSCCAPLPWDANKPMVMTREIREMSTGTESCQAYLRREGSVCPGRLALADFVWASLEQLTPILPPTHVYRLFLSFISRPGKSEFRMSRLWLWRHPIYENQRPKGISFYCAGSNNVTWCLVRWKNRVCPYTIICNAQFMY